MNVAVTRARRQCCLVCDVETVSNDRFLKRLVEYFEENGEYLSASEYQSSWLASIKFNYSSGWCEWCFFQPCIRSLAWWHLAYPWSKWIGSEWRLECWRTRISLLFFSLWTHKWCLFCRCQCHGNGDLRKARGQWRMCTFVYLLLDLLVPVTRPWAVDCVALLCGNIRYNMLMQSRVW